MVPTVSTSGRAAASAAQPGAGHALLAALARTLAWLAMLVWALPPPGMAQPVMPPPAATPPAEAQSFNTAQLDAMLAPIALYPDDLLVQVLMASAYPLQIVAAARWFQQGDNKKLSGEALAKALEAQPWDPTVKSLLPFPQVLLMLNDQLEWTQQLGYAVSEQQAAVMDSIQRLRRQAQLAGSLKTTEQQRVTVEEQAIVIQPASPQTVYVPTYNPNVVYGTWPYASYPPVYYPPAPGYAYSPFVSGLAFAAGVAVVASLWGCGSAHWGSGNVAINASRYNNINVNRPPVKNGAWRPPAGGSAGGRPARPPGGPVGAAARPSQLPANAIGRANAELPRSALDRPGGAGGNRAGAGGGQRPGDGGLGGGQNRPGGGGGGGIGGAGGGIGGGAGAAQRPAGGFDGRGGSAAQRPAGGAGQGLGAAQRPAAADRSAFSGTRDGNRASQFSARGAQSRSAPASVNRGSFGGGGRGGAARGGGGRRGR